MVSQTAKTIIKVSLLIFVILLVVGSLVGEFIGGNHGLGYIILVSSYRLETVNMFGAIMLSTLMGIIFFLIISFIEKKVVFWYKPEEIDRGNM